MINRRTTILINEDIEDINECIRRALDRTADALLDAYGLIGIDLAESVTTKTNRDAGFAKYVKLGVLQQDEPLTQEYIHSAYDIYLTGRAGRDEMTQEQFQAFVKAKSESGLEFKRSFVPVIRVGIGIFLVSLHCSRVVTLPSCFNWPVSRVRNSATSRAATMMCTESELVSFVRSIDTVSDTELDCAFAAVGRLQKRIEWYSTYATKMLLSTGWHTPEDVNLKDLALLREDEDKRSTSASALINSAQKTLVDSIRRKFGDRCPVSLDQWNRKGKKGIRNAATVLMDIDEAELLDHIAGMPAAVAAPKKMRALGAVVGLDFELREKTRYWIELQELYIKKTKRENYKSIVIVLGILNLYLFFYLPNWYRHHPETNIPFPETPNSLVGSIFVSRLMAVDASMPATLIEFMRARATRSKWTNHTEYGYLKQLEVFFGFLASNADSLEHCNTFRQPISKYDYPPVSGGIGTNKRSFPRRLFGVFVMYVEAVKSYIDIAVAKAANLEIDAEDLFTLLKINAVVVDTQRPDVHAIMGGSPIVVVGGENVPIRYLPYFPSADWYTLKKGNVVKIPRPHSINQILVALYTGLRHNHIQWLDVDTYDSLVEDEDSDYTRLLVNTDKVKKRPWAPDVNFRVIEVLRSQKAWRDLVAEDSFSNLHFYNDNAQTTYPQFRPLFSYDPHSGLPHSDYTYSQAWLLLLIGFQTWVNEHLIKGNDRPLAICKLVARGVEFVDNEVVSKRKKYENWPEQFCPLRIATETSPHSSRVSVVTNFIHYLSPELIGKHITGQEIGTVAYYVRPSPEDLEQAAVHQAMEIQHRALRSHVENFFKEGDAKDPMSKASSINSKLARSMQVDIGQTIVRYGCMSISVGEEAESGIDVLAEIGSSRVAYNTTEICPYNNVCPPHIIRQINGIGRCALCPAAVRSIDHLPAVIAAKKRNLELLSGIDKLMVERESSASYTDLELDEMEEKRQRIGEELVGWQLCESVLETTRARLAAGVDTKSWVVENPEILERDLRRVEIPTNDALHLLGRLTECVSYPGHKSPQMERAFDMLRRRVLAAAGDIEAALSMEIPVDAASECAGLLRSLVEAKGLTVNDVIMILETNRHLKLLPPNRPGTSLMEGFNEFAEKGNKHLQGLSGGKAASARRTD